MRRGFKKWAEDLAIEQRLKLGLKAEAPLGAKKLADHYGVIVINPRDVSGMEENELQQLLVTDLESWSAITILRNGQAIIINNIAHSSRRQESNLMHEMAHLLCKHRPSHMVQSNNLPFALRTYDPVQEEEARWLGGCLQLPRAALMWIAQRGMNDEAVANYFSASVDLVQFRRRATGVDIQFSRRRAKTYSHTTAK